MQFSRDKVNSLRKGSGWQRNIGPKMSLPLHERISTEAELTKNILQRAI
jgi:hypothetical protein